MITCASVSKEAIAEHYNQGTLFYRLLWGEHIHHGLWHADESPREAQLRTVQYLADQADIQPWERVLDVGCGMGGSAIYLARRLGCHVTGLTLSRFQRCWAALAAWFRGVSRQVRFTVQDVETAEFSPWSFDVIWNMECTEHLFDKAAYFRRAVRWLRPGGRLATIGWLAGPEPHSSEARQLIHEICEGFLMPSLCTAAEYRRWMADAGLVRIKSIDLSDRVVRTWEICGERVRRCRARTLARMLGWDRQVLFLDRFDTILRAFRSGAFQLGCLVGHKP
jgi:tocopherol O-methyltransferase